MRKRCTKCERILGCKLFHRDPQKKDGLCSACKDCRAHAASRHYRKHSGKILASNLRWKKANHERVLELARQYAARPEIRKLRRLIAKRWRQSDRGREWMAAFRKTIRYQNAAHDAIKRAVASGRLIRPQACEKCLVKSKLHAHHHRGYSKEHYLDVQWLCPKCHSAFQLGRKRPRLSTVRG